MKVNNVTATILDYLKRGFYVSTDSIYQTVVYSLNGDKRTIEDRFYTPNKVYFEDGNTLCITNDKTEKTIYKTISK